MKFLLHTILLALLSMFVISGNYYCDSEESCEKVSEEIASAEKQLEKSCQCDHSPKIQPLTTARLSDKATKLSYIINITHIEFGLLQSQYHPPIA